MGQSSALVIALLEESSTLGSAIVGQSSVLVGAP